MNNIAKATTQLALVGLVSACGSGGGDGGDALVLSPTAALDSSNQWVAAQDVATTGFMPLLAVQTLTGAQVTDESALFSIARDQWRKLPSYLIQARLNSTLAGVIQSETVPCTVLGSLTVSGVDADNNGEASVGDSLTVSSNGCLEPQGALGGTLSFVINSLTGTVGSDHYSASLAMTFGNFSLTNSGASASVNGDLALSVAATGVNSATETLSTPSLSVAGTYGGVTRTRSLVNYSASTTTTPDATYGILTSYSMSGFLTSSALSSQTISFATHAPFVRRGADYYPSTGVMLITGANNTQIRLTALSPADVQQALDGDGDGSYESSTTVAWNTLI